MNNIINKKLEYNLKINDFEGPLDLLLYLINKNKMDIMNIELNVITDEYISYLNDLNENNIEVSSEFLVIASTLVNIKAKRLLPKEETIEDEVTEEEMLNMIFEYKKYKEISETIYSMYLKNFGTFSKEMEDIKFKGEFNFSNINTTKLDMYEMYLDILVRKSNKYNKNKERVKHILKKDEFTVEKKSEQILCYLEENKKMDFIKFYTKDFNIREIVTAFLSSLELAKLDKIKVLQNTMFKDIIITGKND